MGPSLEKYSIKVPFFLFVKGNIQQVSSGNKTHCWLRKVAVRNFLGGGAYRENVENSSNITFKRKTLLPGLYTVELKVQLFGSYSADVAKKYYNSTKKCWFQIDWDNVVPIIVGGNRRVLDQHTSVKLDASPSYDPNFDSNNGLRFTWFCKTNHHFCKPLTLTVPTHELLGLEVGTYEMFLSLSNPATGLPPSVTSQIIDIVINPTIKGFELACHKNCRNTVVHELTHLQVNILPPGKSIVWTYRENGGEEKNGASLRQLGSPEDIFIIKENALTPGTKYEIRATVGNTYGEIHLKTVEPPKRGKCKVNPATGLRGYTLFTVTCVEYKASYPEGKPLRYNIYQKVESGQPGASFEPLLSSSSQISFATDLQFIKEGIVVEVSDVFGAKVTETLSIKLTDQKVSSTEVDNLVFKVQDNLRHSEVEKGTTSVYTIAQNLQEASEESKVIKALIESINKVPILELKDAFQIAACSHFLLSKSIDRNRQILLSESVKTASMTLNTIATSIKDIIKTIDHVEMESLIGLLRSILGSVNSLIHSKNEHLTDQNEDAEIYQKNYFDYREASVNILKAINDVSSTILHQMILCQNPIKIENEFIVLLLIVERMERLVKMGNIDPSAGGNAYIKFDTNLAPYYRNKDIELQVAEFKENLFWWFETEYSMNSEHLNVELNIRDTKDVGPIHLDYPLHLFMKINEVASETFLAEVEQPLKDLTLEEKDLYVRVFKIERKKDTGGKLFVKFHDLGSSELDVIILFDKYPDYDIVKNKGETLSAGQNLYESQSLPGLPEDSIIYLGVTPSSKHFEGEKISFKYEIFDHLCRVWAKEKWDIKSCEVGSDSTEEVAHCQCKHLSMFGASVLVPPNQIHLLQDIALILTLKDNPYVFSMVIAFLVIYIFLFIWAQRRDKKDENQRVVRLLADNFPGDTYGYLLAVFTGEKTLSGTTAKVGVKIYGSNGAESHAHILNHDKNNLQLGQDNWFLIFTPNHLGDIGTIQVWHDNSGAAPDWYCKKMILYDLTTNDLYEFPVDKWLSVSVISKDWKLEWKLKTKKLQERSWKDLARENFFIGLRETHLWFSIFVRHPRTSYTRLQRLTVALCLVMLSMLLALMFYGAAQRMVEDDPSFSLSVREFVVAVECALISFPVAFLLGTLFKKSRQPGPKRIVESQDKKKKRSFVATLLSLLKAFLTLDPLLPVGMSERENRPGDADTKKRQIYLICAWIMSFTIIFVSSFLLILYGLKMGPNKSIVWVTSTFIRLAQAIFITQPVRILAKALLVTSIFKEMHRNQMLFSVEYKGIDDEMKNDNQYMSKLMELRSKSMYSPLSTLDVMILSKNRKKKEKRRWTIINFIFVLVLYISLCILVSGYTSSAAYHQAQHLLHLFKTAQSENDYDVDYVYNDSRFFKYVVHTLIPSLHTIHWYNGEDLPLETEEIGTLNHSWRGWLSDYSNKLLGVPRLRQLRIKNGTCTVAKMFQRYFNSCNSSYSPFIEDRKTYSTGWTVPEFDGIEEIWNYSSTIETETTGLFGASGYFYPGGGYVRNLGTNLKDSSRGIVKLQLENWFDQLTRLIVVEFNIYNVFSNVFSQVTIMFESLASGVIRTKVFIDSVYHQFYVNTLDVAFLTALVFFIVVLILSLLRIVIFISVRGLPTFIKSKGNLIDLMIILVGFSSVMTYLMRIGMFKIYSSAYEKTDNESFVSFSKPFYHDGLVCVFLCVLVMVATVRLLQLAQFGRYFCILRDTIKESSPYLICALVLIMFFTSLLSVATYMIGIQHSQIFYCLLVPRVDFINHQERSILDSNKILFKAAINMIYLLGGMLITAIFIVFYAKSKFNYISLGKDGEGANHFLRIIYGFNKGLKSLIRSDEVKFGFTTRKKSGIDRSELYNTARESAAWDFKLKEKETEDILKHFVTLSKQHQKMCDQLDQILELID